MRFQQLRKTQAHNNHVNIRELAAIDLLFLGSS